MASPKIDASRLQDSTPFSTNIQCVICHDIPLCPKECQNCQNLFCNDCITSWLEIKNVCPCFCSDEELKMRVAHKFIRDIISNLRVKCVNYDFGCKEYIRFENLSSHEEKSCLFRKTSCPNGTCDKEILFKDCQEHASKCFEEKIQCFECKAIFSKPDFKKHFCVLSLFQEIEGLEKLYEENSKEVAKLQADISNIMAENQKKSDFSSQIEKNIKERIKDLKFYMKSEAQTIIQNLIANNSSSWIPVKQQSQIEKNKTNTVNINQSQNQQIFSKFFDEDHENNDNGEDSERKPEKAIENSKNESNEKKNSMESYSEEECKFTKESDNCHKYYQNIAWIPDPERSKCNVCSQIKLIRYKCNICKKNLCVFCKKPLIKKKICPIGHRLIRNMAKEALECDICLTTIPAGSFCFSDAYCEVDICSNCGK